MIELSDAQKQAVQEHPGEPLRLVDPDTRQAFVLVAAEVYDRIKQLLEDDWTPEEKLQALAESGKRAGWDAPEMDAYDDYDAHRCK